MSKHLCDTCRIHLMDCDVEMCDFKRLVAKRFGDGIVGECKDYKPMAGKRKESPEVVRVMTVEITHIGHEELGADSLRMKCLEASAKNVLRSVFPHADNINIARVQEFVLDGE